jgi:hypothetical protein
MTIKCEPMVKRPSGWTEWIHPLPGFLLQCCGCDMIHQMEVAIVPKKAGTFPLNKGEGRRVVVFRMSHTIPAQRIEAQRAGTTEIGPVEDESRVGNADAP